MPHAWNHGRPLVRPLWQAINALERQLCGEAAVTSAAVADGHALAGARGARLLDPRRVDAAGSGTSAPHAGWVEHRILSERTAQEAGDPAFELVARTAQEAMDHCLLAHAMVAGLKRSGVCSVSRDLAESPAFVQLLDATALENFRSGLAALDFASVEEATVEAARIVSALTGRTGDADSINPPPAGNGRPLVLGASSGGPWVEALLLDTVAWLGVDRPAPYPELHLQHGTPLILTLGAARTEPAIDLLFVPHPATLQEVETLRRVAPGGALLLYGGSTASRVWRALPTALRREVVRRDLRVFWSGADPARPEMLHGALLRSLPATDGERDNVIDRLGRLATTKDDALERLLLGAAALESLERDVLERTVDAPAEPVVATPAPGADPDPQGWRDPLHNFHSTGGGLSGDAGALRWPLEPAALAALGQAASAQPDYPRVVGYGSTIAPLRQLLIDALEQPQTTGHSSVLLQHLSLFCELARRHLARLGRPRKLRVLVAELGPTLAEAAALDATSEQRLAGEVERLQALPLAEALALGCATELLFHGFVDESARQRRPLAAATIGETESLVGQLEELLRLDDNRTTADASGAALSETLGEAGKTFMDPQALVQRLPQRGRKALTAARRERIVETLAVLAGFLERSRSAPGLYVLWAEQPGWFEAPHGVRAIEHADGLRAAIGLFDGHAEKLRPVFRALRTARLELRNAFDEARHPALIEGLDWQAVPAEELALLPAIVVWETAERLRGPALAAFSELLRSGRPLTVLVPESTTEHETDRIWQTLSGYDPGLGYLAIAHREALIVQSSLGCPEHLCAGLRQVARGVGPAAVIAAVPDRDSPVPPGLQLAATLHGRAIPCFVYDPGAGTDWVDRFSLEGNPQPDRPWPRLTREVSDGNGQPATTEEAWTHAHTAALDPAFREHFRRIGPAAWLDELVEIEAYLALAPEQQRRAIPYLWVVDDDGRPTRAVMTRALAFACRDRARSFRILQELAGTKNAYALRAAEEASSRRSTESDARIAELEATHAEQLRHARVDGARVAVERIVRVLVANPAAALPSGSLPTAASSVTATATPALGPTATAGSASSAAQTGAPAAVAVAAPAPQAAAAEGPYIDSFLCTTCNECTQLNSRLFVYNADRQATIGDPRAGTFKELVKAAEKCPARCIHPGSPRPGDKTATPALIARAAPFN